MQKKIKIFKNRLEAKKFFRSAASYKLVEISLEGGQYTPQELHEKLRSSGTIISKKALYYHCKRLSDVGIFRKYMKNPMNYRKGVKYEFNHECLEDPFLKQELQNKNIGRGIAFEHTESLDGLTQEYSKICEMIKKLKRGEKIFYYAPLPYLLSPAFAGILKTVSPHLKILHEALTSALKRGVKVYCLVDPLLYLGKCSEKSDKISLEERMDAVKKVEELTKTRYKNLVFINVRKIDSWEKEWRGVYIISEHGEHLISRPMKISRSIFISGSNIRQEFEKVYAEIKKFDEESITTLKEIYELMRKSVNE